jgi:hypothetical protein
MSVGISDLKYAGIAAPLLLNADYTALQLTS